MNRHERLFRDLAEKWRDRLRIEFDPVYDSPAEVARRLDEALADVRREVLACAEAYAEAPREQVLAERAERAELRDG